MDLTICPDEIRALDPHADEAWSLFLKKTGISMSVDGKIHFRSGAEVY